MKRTWTIIGVSDVLASIKWYQAIFGQPQTPPSHDYFGQVLDADGTVLLCLHRWGAHEHPSLESPDVAPPGNGLLLFFRVDDFGPALKRARSLVTRLTEEPHVNPNTGTQEFSLRDPDGYYVTISALSREHETIRIRIGVPADAAQLADLAARTFRDTFGADTSPGDMAIHLAHAYGPPQQGRELADPNIVTLLVDSGDMFAGYAQLRRGPAPSCVEGDAPMELWRFYLVQEWHGQGLARTLMHRVDEEAHRAGARTLWLGVWERNERAKAFYRKCGFVDVGAHVFLVGSDAQTDRILIRPVVKAPQPRRR